MAFGGANITTNIGKNIQRLNGATLAAGASGTIGDFGDAGADIQLPNTAFALDANTNVSAMQGIAISAPLRIAKGGAPFRITVTNDAAGATGSLEIIVQHFHTLIQ